MDGGSTAGVLAEWRVAYGIRHLFGKESWYHSCAISKKNSKLDIDGIDIVVKTSLGDMFVQVKSGHSGGRSAHYYTDRGIVLIRVCSLSPEDLKKKIDGKIREGLNFLRFRENRKLKVVPRISANEINCEKEKLFKQAVLVYERGFAYSILPLYLTAYFDRSVKEKEEQFRERISHILPTPISQPHALMKAISVKKRSGINTKPVKFRMDKCVLDNGIYTILKTEVRDVIENLPPPLPNGRAVPEPKVLAEVLTIPKMKKNRSTKAKPKYFINSAGQLEAYKF